MNTRLNAKFVKHILTDRDMTARDLARIAGISEATMYNMMAGDAFTSRTLDKIAEALGCHPADLIVVDDYARPRGMAASQPTVAA